MNQSVRKAATRIVVVAGIVLFVFMLFSMNKDDEIRIAKFNASSAITKAGYPHEGVAIAPCRGQLSQPECGPNDEYIVGFATVVDDVRREGYVTVEKTTLTPSAVTFWETKKTGGAP